MDGGAQYNPRTVEEVFRDFKGRRAGLIKALTTGKLLLQIASRFAAFSCSEFPFYFNFIRFLRVLLSMLQMSKSSTSNVIRVRFYRCFLMFLDSRVHCGEEMLEVMHRRSSSH